MKNISKKFWRYVTDSNYRWNANDKLGLYKKLDDEHFIKGKFEACLGYELDLENPSTFNEKIQWLKLYDRKPLYTKMVDKYEVKRYVASIIGEEYIIPTLGVWERFDDIDFSSLPDQFVLKCTHDSGGLVIVKDKHRFDKEAARKKIKKSLSTNFYYIGREWPYKNVRPRIIAEQYMEDSTTSELRDYKFFCFGGVVKCFKVDFDRFINHHANYFDNRGNILKIGEVVCPPDYNRKIDLPQKLSLMLELAEILSKDIPFLRTDFYDVNGSVYFGELTFYPASGFGKFIYDGNEELLGSWLKLPDNSGIPVRNN